MSPEADPGGAWQPLTPAGARALLGGLEVPWWVAGGQAIDLFLGRTTRDHGDLDVSILRGDAPAMREWLGGWELFEAGGGELRRLAHGAPVGREIHGIWCRRDAGAPWSLELLLEEGDRREWRFRRDPRITLPFADLLRSRDGIPYVAPEVQLLYKAKDPRPRDEADFAAVLPQLPRRAREWLRRTLERTHPDHAWIGRLAT